MSRLAFWLIAVAFAVWLALALLVGRSGGEPTPTASDPEPTVPPPADTAKDDQIRHLEGELRASRRARVRERTGFRRRLRYVIHSPVLAGHWLERAFGCIHAGEGSWSSATGNGYYGGLQFDLSFQRTYAPWAVSAFGTANRWPVSVQVATAIRAYVSGRRFSPWPNTSRACGLR